MQWNFIERKVSNGFRHYGYFVARNYAQLILFPLLLTVVLGTGIFHLHRMTDHLYIFTPTDAVSKMERQSIHEKWPLTDGHYIPGRSVTQAREVQVIALAKNDGNILEEPYAEAVFRLDLFIQNHVKVKYEGRFYGYHSLCLGFGNQGCPGNRQVHLISRLFKSGINITYPMMEFGSDRGYIGSSLGGVTVGKSRGGLTIVESAKAWLLIYQLKFYPKRDSFVSAIWELELQQRLHDYPLDPYINFTFQHSQTIPDELEKNVDSLVPRFLVSFLLLIIFSSLCSLSFLPKSFLLDWALSKPSLACLGLLSAGMGVISGVGLLTYARAEFADHVCVMPFLVMAVGADNMFLMVASVRRSPRTHAADVRIAECLGESAVSILITATTDVLSFMAGMITSTPAVRMFCLHTAVALSFTFLYQVTFFASLLYLFTKCEGEHKNGVFLCKTIPVEEKERATVMQKMFNLASRVPTDVVDQVSLPAHFFRDWYSAVLIQPGFRLFTFLLYSLYVVTAVYGCYGLRRGLEPTSMLVDGSYAAPHYHNIQKYFWGYGATVQIVVNNAIDFRNPKERQVLTEFIDDISAIPHCIGKETLQFFYTEMQRYREDQLEEDMEDADMYNAIRQFLYVKNWPWSEDVKWATNVAPDQKQITAFRFILGMQNFSSSTSQEEAVHEFREAAARHPSLNVTTFMPYWLFVDQFYQVIPNTFQNVTLAIFCMLVVAFLLIPDLTCVVWVAITIGSIDLGVLGYMTLWDVNLDAISMITIIMSIGFSVDYSAHIAYGFVVSKATDPKKRVQDALGDLGWPMVQGGLSTILAVSVLATVPSYLVVTFYKTVFLSISIGLLHGLLFLPLMLSTFFACGTQVRRTVAKMTASSLSQAKMDPCPLSPTENFSSLAKRTSSPLCEVPLE